jgi:Flp pilus assembly protein TadG
MARRRNRSPRRAVAAVEFAFLAPVLIGLLVGLWQVGRIVEVKQILDNATREGARLASQCQIINLTGNFTNIHTSSGQPNVQDTVREYLAAAGVVNSTTVTDVTVTFQFLDGDTTRTDPYQGLKGQRFQVTTTLPVQDINWTPFTTTSIMSSTAVWCIMIDDPFTVNTTIPGWSP